MRSARPARPIFIHARGQKPASTGAFPAYDLNPLVFRKPLPKEGAPDKDARAILAKVAREIVALAIANDSDAIVVRSGRHICTAGVFLAAVLRKFLPSISFILSDESLDLEASLTTMRKGVFDFVIREADPDKLVQEIFPSLDAPASIQSTKVLWVGEHGIVEWNRKRSENPDTLLVLMPAWNNDFAPFGLAHISSALKSAGFGVDVLDLNCPFWAKMKGRFKDCAQFENFMLWSQPDRYKEYVRAYLDETFADLEKAVRAGRYKYIGFSVFDTNRHPIVESLDLIRAIDPSIKLFAGGPSCEPHWTKAMFEKQNGFDAIVFGEGEFTAIDLLTAWRDGSDRPIPGAARRLANGEVVRGGTRPLADMKTLPHPDFEGFPIYNYSYHMLPIFFTRGCVAKCTFCAETQYWKKFRVLPPERIVDSIGHSIREYGIRTFQVNDSLMNGSLPHLEQICDGIIARGYDIEFTGYCRLEKKFTTEMIRKLYRAGCRTIAFGIESGSQKVIDLMQKHVEVENYERILKDAYQAGIEIFGCIVVGFPGETWIDFFKTVFMLLKVHRYLNDVNLSVLVIPEGTPLAAQGERFGIEYPFEGAMHAWSLADNSNTPRIRYLRYRIMRGLWKLLKKKKTSPTGWDFEYAAAAEI